MWEKGFPRGKFRNQRLTQIGPHKVKARPDHHNETCHFYKSYTGFLYRLYGGYIQVMSHVCIYTYICICMGLGLTLLRDSMG